MARIFGWLRDWRSTKRRWTDHCKRIEMEPEVEGDLLDAGHHISGERDTPPSCVLACEVQEERLQIEVVITDESGPLDGVLVRLTRADGSVHNGIADDGKICFDGLPQGDYKVVLPSIDRDICNCELVALDERVSVDLMWEPPGELRIVDQVDQLIVESGDCFASLAFDLGTSLQTLISANKDLEMAPYMLAPGTTITIPTLHPFTVEVSAGQRCFVKVKVPHVSLRLFMETYALKPRDGVPFDLQVFDEDWSELAWCEIDGGRSHTTQKHGLIEVRTRASARYALLSLRPVDGEIEHYNLAIGELEPPNRPGGLRARLNNLAFYCGEDPYPSSTMETSKNDPALTAALDSFATFRGSKSAEVDNAVVDKYRS